MRYPRFPVTAKEIAMREDLARNRSIAATYEAVATAGQAIHRLRAAGFTEVELTVACPGKFKEACICATRDAAPTRPGVAQAMASGGVVGVALGGLPLAAAVFTGDLIAPAAAAALLVGGGALVGGLSNLIVNKGSEVTPHDYVQQAIRADRIVVGIDIHGADADGRLAAAEHILTDTGGSHLHRIRGTAIS
jgi:hypothetical protein